jgi:beta-lactamase class A
MTRERRRLGFYLATLLAFIMPATAHASAPGPLAELQTQLDRAVFHAPGTVGIAIEDLATGYTSGVNATASLPAASTIKIPVMVEVFRQMADGTIDLNTKMHLLARDRDWGSGDLAGGRVGETKSVEQLLWLMINDSDNTATNMLIRRVGRQHVNRTMSELGLRTTRLGDYIRTAGERIRYTLRSSPRDMVKLLDLMARDHLVDEWSSREMLAILTGQTHNTLLPQPLPRELKIAHKTGSLHDTLNDVGIVYLSDEPYIIAVMTTRLQSLSIGRRFIRKVSKMAYEHLGRFARWREESGMPAFKLSVNPRSGGTQPLAPDLEMWNVRGPLPQAVGHGATLWETPTPLTRSPTTNEN